MQENSGSICLSQGHCPPVGGEIPLTPGTDMRTADDFQQMKQGFPSDIRLMFSM